MEQYFNTIFEDIRYERGRILILSLIEPSILHQSKFTDHESKLKLFKISLFKKNLDKKI